MKAHNKETQAALTPQVALQLLKDGNQRFVNNTNANRDLLAQKNDTINGQWPFAVVLSCIDSRTSTELIFDQGIGDVFNARIAGNIVNEDILGSMEFACKVAGAKLILVVGHTKCGAVKGACDNVEMGNLTALLHKIKPAVDAENTTTEDRTSHNATFVQNVATINVKQTVQNIKDKSPVLNDMFNNGEIAIAGAMYDIETGVVEFYN